MALQDPSAPPSQQGVMSAGHPQGLVPLMEPGEGLAYDPYLVGHYPSHLSSGPLLHPQSHPHPPQEGLLYGYPSCEPVLFRSPITLRNDPAFTFSKPLRSVIT